MRWFVILLLATAAHADSRGRFIAMLGEPGAKFFTPVRENHVARCAAMAITDNRELQFTSFDGTRMTQWTWEIRWAPDAPEQVTVTDGIVQTWEVAGWGGGGGGGTFPHTHPIAYLPDRVEFAGQPLYYTLAGCRAALTRPFAHDVPAFVLQPTPAHDQWKRALAHPGFLLYTPVKTASTSRCAAMRVTDEGLVFATYDGHTIEKSTWQLSWDPDAPETIGIAEPSHVSLVVDPDWPWGGGSMGLVCEGDYEIRYRTDHVEIGEQPLYFTLAACRAALRTRPVAHETPEFAGGC